MIQDPPPKPDSIPFAISASSAPSALNPPSLTRRTVTATALLASAAALLALLGNLNLSVQCPPASAVHSPDFRLDLNSADAASIALLPGIGPAGAQRIVDARQTAGPFKDLPDLQRRIKGIGYKTAARIAPYVEFK